MSSENNQLQFLNNISMAQSIDVKHKLLQSANF